MTARSARRRLAAAALAACAVVLPVGAAPDSAPPPGVAAAPAPGPLRFVEVGERAGVRFVHATRDFGDRHKAEVLEMFTDGGAAVAVADVDGDGDDDLFLTDSDRDRPQHLLLNEGLVDGVPRFRDVAATAGAAGGNGERTIVADALFFDHDNDGRQDLWLGRFGTPLLLRNDGPGDDGVPRFVDVTAAAGLGDGFGNTIAVIAFDFDGDGWLDVLEGQYFADHDLLALETTKVLPDDLDNATNGGGLTLWRNVPGSGGGRAFVDATAAAGLAHHTGWSLDLGHADLDGDGWPDVYVAGDYGTDRLFRNRGDGTFADVTEEALGWDTRKGMNVDMGDFDRDGHLDIYVTNITDEYMKECNMLWHNLGDGTFVDVSRETGTCDTDWGWAGKFADLDNDGWLDLFVVNGLRSAGEENYIPLLLETIIKPGVDFRDLDSYPDIGDRTWSGYQRQRLFHNLGDGTFREVAGDAGVDNDLDGRGIGVGDFDGDGRLDLVQTAANAPSLFYLGRTERSGHWLALSLTGAGPAAEGDRASGRASSRDAIGARVRVHAGGETFLRELDGGNGYAGQSSKRLHFGLGAADRVDWIEVRWPSGRVEKIAAADGAPLPIDRVARIAEGRGLVE